MKKKDTYSYKGWLVSDNFFKRVFAVVGYYLAGQIMLTLLCFAALFWLFLLVFLGSFLLIK